MTADLFTPWGTPVERERRRRIRLSLWAFAYEIADAPMVSDARFDQEALASNPHMATDWHHDDWWRAYFDRSTGLWVRDHPELFLIERLFLRLTTIGTTAI